MHIHEASEFLYAATYGRSSYKINIAEDILDTNDNAFGNSVTLFPNPAHDIVTITSQETGVAAVTFYDALGRIVLEQMTQFSSPSGTALSITSLPGGLYYVVVDVNGKKTTKKLIVE